jgi:hypothetical protein
MAKMFWTLVTLSFFIPVSLVAANPAQAPQPTGQTYIWYGELVALDQPTQLMTVKARLVDQALKDIGQFKSGDKIVLGWSGFDKYADVISRVSRFDANKKTDAAFEMPVEFLAFDATNQFVTFKSKIPAASLTKIKTLKPGEWITATSKHRPANETDAIVMVDPFVTSSGSSN